MQQNSINSQFQQYADTLYKAASRMLDKRNPQYEDKVQDLVILAYEEFKRKADQGTIMSLPLLIHFMKLRKPEVQLEMRGDSRTPKKDVFNKRNYYEGKLELYSIDNPLNIESSETFAESIKDDKNLEEEKKQIIQSLKELQNHKSNQNEILILISESKKYIQNFVNHFEEISLIKKKEGMKTIVKQIIVDREKNVARCALRVIPLVKQHPIFSLFSKDEPIEKSQLSSSLDCVPPTRFELVFQA